MSKVDEYKRYIVGVIGAYYVVNVTALRGPHKDDDAMALLNEDQVYWLTTMGIISSTDRRWKWMRKDK